VIFEYAKIPTLPSLVNEKHEVLRNAIQQIRIYARRAVLAIKTTLINVLSMNIDA
jgi:hypothetical protein